jgi:hypothetical protein
MSELDEMSDDELEAFRAEAVLAQMRYGRRAEMALPVAKRDRTLRFDATALPPSQSLRTMSAREVDEAVHALQQRRAAAAGLDMTRFDVRAIRLRITRGKTHDDDELHIALGVRQVETGERIEVFSVAVGTGDSWDGEAIRTAVIDALVHEVDECLFVNGKRVRDPHPVLPGVIFEDTRGERWEVIKADHREPDPVITLQPFNLQDERRKERLSKLLTEMRQV